jgi:hypothetical protein
MKAALCLGLLGTTLHAQQASLGFAYPAGGQRGSEFQVVLGRQSLGGPIEVYMGGEGIRTDIVTFLRPFLEDGELDWIEALCADNRRRALRRGTGQEATIRQGHLA